MKNNLLEGCGGFIGGCLIYAVGGFDHLFTSLLVLMLLDWFIGGLKSFKLKQFSSSAFIWGFVNKIVAILVVVAINFVQIAMELNIPVRETVLTLLLLNEVLSVLRNASKFVTGLEFLSDYFETIKINVLNIFKISTQDKKVGDIQDEAIRDN